MSALLKSMPSISRRVLRNRVARQLATDPKEAAKIAEFNFVAHLMSLAAWTTGISEIMPKEMCSASNQNTFDSGRQCWTRGQQLRYLAELSDLIDIGEGVMVTADGMMPDADGLPDDVRDATDDYPCLRDAVDRVAARVVERSI